MLDDAYGNPVGTLSVLEKTTLKVALLTFYIVLLNHIN
jgi:hypothetical protein